LILEFTLAAILIELTPGPNMTWLAVVGTSRGRSTALAAVAGIALGLAVAAAIAGTSLAAIFARIPQLFDILRWLGTLYLFCLRMAQPMYRHLSIGVLSTSGCHAQKACCLHCARGYMVLSIDR
jgi:hypothetical protein